MNIEWTEEMKVMIWISSKLLKTKIKTIWKVYAKLETEKQSQDDGTLYYNQQKSFKAQILYVSSSIISKQVPGWVPEWKYKIDKQ